jgi:hypothetical protein
LTRRCILAAAIIQRVCERAQTGSDVMLCAARLRLSSEMSPQTLIEQRGGRAASKPAFATRCTGGTTVPERSDAVGGAVAGPRVPRPCGAINDGPEAPTCTLDDARGRDV